LLLKHRVSALVDPVLYCLNVDSLFVLLHFLFFAAPIRLLFCLLLKSFEFLNLLRHQLVCLLEIRLQFIHSLVFVLDCSPVGLNVLAGLLFVGREALFAIFFGRLCFVSLLLHLRKLDLHGFQSRLLLHQGFLDRILFLFLLALLVV